MNIEELLGYYPKYVEPEIKESLHENEEFLIQYPKDTPFSQKLKELKFKSIKLHESVLVVGASGCGKTLWLQWVKYILRYNGIEFIEFNESEFESHIKQWDYNVARDINYYLSKEYLLMDQLFNAIERISKIDKGWGFYELLIDRLYQQSLIGHKKVIAVTNRDVFGDTSTPLDIPGDSNRKLKEIFKRRVIIS